MSDRLRVATLNIWGQHGDWAKRRVVLRRGFEALQPDLLALQETVVTPEYDEVREVVGEELHVVHQSQRTEAGLGCSIVSRWAPTRVTEIDLLVTSRVDPTDFVGRSTSPQRTRSSSPSRTGRGSRRGASITFWCAATTEDRHCDRRELSERRYVGGERGSDKSK